MYPVDVDNLINKLGSRFLLVSVIIKQVAKLAENQVDYRKKAYIEKVLKDINDGKIIFNFEGKEFDTEKILLLDKEKTEQKEANEDK